MNKRHRIKRIGLEILKRLLYVNLIGFVIGIFIDGTDVFKDWFYYILYSSVVGNTLWLGNEYFSIYVDKHYSWIEYPIRKLVLRLGFSIAYSTLVMVLLYMFFWFVIFKKPDLTNFFEYNRVSFLIFYAATLIVMLVIHSVAFLKSWQNAALNEEKLKKESIALQLQALRNQVDPHFLFNSLNTLTSLIETEPPKAIRFVKQLSDMFRYMLERDSREITDIGSELKFVEAYVFLQKMRFGNNLKVDISISGDNFCVLPVSLQLLIENAIKHNEISEEFPLTVEITDDENYTIVRNKKQPKLQEVTSQKIGLENLKIRYRFFTDKPVIIENTDDFVVKVPKLKSE